MQPHTSAAVSGGVATSAMIVIAWLFSLAHIAIPDSVQVALASLLTAGLGYFFHTHGQALAASASAAADKARSAAETAAGTVAVLLVILLAMGGLSGCATGTTAPSSQTVLTIACAADKLAPGLTKAGAAIAQIADPTIVDQLAQATEAEALANAAVQAGCNAALAGSKPTAVMPTLAPVGVPPGVVVNAAAPAS